MCEKVDEPDISFSGVWAYAGKKRDIYDKINQIFNTKITYGMT